MTLSSGHREDEIALVGVQPLAYYFEVNMRKSERIIPFLHIIENEDFEFAQLVRKSLGDNYLALSNELKLLWLENPDWRFTQLLVNSGYMPNFPGMWYYKEEHELIPEKYWNRILFWGTYGKNGKQPFKNISIKNMSTNHIKAVLDMKAASEIYLKTMRNELKNRNTVKYV